MNNPWAEEAWRKYRDQLKPFEVDPYAPTVPEDHPNFREVQSIIAEYEATRAKPTDPLPGGWEGYPPLVPLATFGDVVNWLDMKWISLWSTDMGGAPKAAFDEAALALRNAYRLLDDFRLTDRPLRPMPPETLAAAKKQLGALYSWAEKRLKKRPIPTRKMTRTKSKARSTDSVPPRSWRQSNLDAAIRDYAANRASRYGALKSAVDAGNKGAIMAAQKMFGRNVIAKELGVKARAMVTKSEAWQEIASDLGLRRRKIRTIDKSKQIGIERALEERADGDSSTVVEIVARREEAKRKAIARVRESNLPSKKARKVIEHLENDDVDLENMDAVIELAIDQAKEDTFQADKSVGFSR